MGHVDVMLQQRDAECQQGTVLPGGLNHRKMPGCSTPNQLTDSLNQSPEYCPTLFLRRTRLKAVV